jgi:hypothetical protein
LTLERVGLVHVAGRASVSIPAFEFDPKSWMNVGR